MGTLVDENDAAGRKGARSPADDGIYVAGLRNGSAVGKRNELRDRRAAGIHHADPGVAEVGDEQVAVAIYFDVFGAGQQGCSGGGRTAIAAESGHGVDVAAGILADDC